MVILNKNILFKNVVIQQDYKLQSAPRNIDFDNELVSENKRNSFDYPQNESMQSKKLIDKIYKPETVPYTGETMHDFPELACNTKEFEDTEISQDMMKYFIDERTKPYELYHNIINDFTKLKPHNPLVDAYYTWVLFNILD